MRCSWSSLAAGGVLMAAAILSLASANLYEDMLIEDLYKRLSQMDESPYDEEAGDYYTEDNDNIPLDSREAGMAMIRDQEHIEDGASRGGGFQYISGGAGEGIQHLTPEGTQNNTQEVKSDESLPFYCHPPNPCPKGFTEKDGCQTDSEDTADFQKNWIATLMRTGKCTCDEEHMFNCPSRNRGIGAGDKLDQVLSNLLNKGENPYGGTKREHLVAKKSPPRFKRDSPYGEIKREHLVAKKSPPYHHRDYPFGGHKREHLVSKKSPPHYDWELREDEKRGSPPVRRPPNPYLQGHRIHTVAKKG